MVQDIFLSETAQLADVVLPAATWGEKTGTFTNVDRTVHLSEKAVDPPGEAKPDLEIFLDYAHRMDLQDKDGEPAGANGTIPESAFEAWKECTRGRPCDYTGHHLRASCAAAPAFSGPATRRTRTAPNGSTRTGKFWAHPDYCETYGRDLITGAPVEPDRVQGAEPGRQGACIKAAEYMPPHELPSQEFPLQLITGRTLYQFHTRTKTGAGPAAAGGGPRGLGGVVRGTTPAAYGIAEGDLAEVATPRGLRAGAGADQRHPGRSAVPAVPLRLLGHRRRPPADGAGRAANELTITDWDAASKQPIFKTAAARHYQDCRPATDPSPAPTTTASAPAGDFPEDARTKGIASGADGRSHRTRQEGHVMKFGLVLEELHRSENDLAHHLLVISERHKVDHEIYHLARDLARWSQQHVRDIADTAKNYGQDLDPEPRSEAGLMETIREKGSETGGPASRSRDAAAAGPA